MWVWKEGVLPQCVPHFIRLPCLVDMKERGMLRVKSSLILLINALSLLHLYCKAMSWLICLACFVNCARHWGAWKEQLKCMFFLFYFFIIFKRAEANMQISGFTLLHNFRLATVTYQTFSFQTILHFIQIIWGKFRSLLLKDTVFERK